MYMKYLLYIKYMTRPTIGTDSKCFHERDWSQNGQVLYHWGHVLTWQPSGLETNKIIIILIWSFTSKKLAASKNARELFIMKTQNKNYKWQEENSSVY